MEQLLDESPINSDREQALDSLDDAELSDQEEELFDSETFKGSFLQEMEKLCRPLKFERRRHDIYTHTEDSSEENILAFMEDSQEAGEQKLDLNTAPSTYIIDFQAQSSTQCNCKCHLDNENRRSSSPESNSAKQVAQNPKKNQQEKVQSYLNVIQKEGWKKEQERNWTSLSLKQYKQKIKKKLQQKR